MVIFNSLWILSVFVIFIIIEIVSVNKDNKDDGYYKHNELDSYPPLEDESGSLISTIPIKRAIKQPCPSGFTFFNSSEGLCFILIEDKHPYPPRCPYNNYLAHDYDQSLYRLFRYEVIWVRAVRNLDGVHMRPFSWTEPSQRYGQVLTDYEYNPENLFLTNCMTIHKGTLTATNCSENHKALCVYSASPSRISRYCSDKNPGLTCINADLNIDSGNCFCQKPAVSFFQSRNDICSSLAEPRQLYQSVFILSGFPRSDLCWFGLHQSYERGFVWSSDSSPITYTLWTESTDFRLPYAAFSFQNPGWTLTIDRVLSCGLCQWSVQSERASVSTFYSTRTLEDSRFLTVVVRNPIELSNYFGHHFMMYCFSDMNSNGLFEKVTRYVSDVPSNSNQYIYKIFLNNAYPALYWCEGYSHPNMTLIRSKPMMVSYYNNVYRTNYAIRVYMHMPEDIDPFEARLHVQATDAIRNMTERTNIVLAVRPIQFMVAGDDYFELIIHLSTQRSSYTLAQEYEVLRNSLEEVNRQHRYFHNVSTFLNSYFCLESFTYTGHRNLTWPRTTIGSTIVPRELCVQEDGSPVTRTCVGDFTLGGQWSNVNGSCARNFSYPQSLLDLHDLLHNDTAANSRIDELLYTLVQNISNPLMIELHLIAEILKTFTSTNLEHDVRVILKIISEILYYNNELLKETQLRLNSTDAILDVVDILSSNQNSTGLLVTDNVIVTTLNLSDARGVALYHNSGNSFQNSELITLYPNTSEEVLYDGDIEAAVFIPNTTYKELVTYFTHNTSIKMMVTFFNNHNLFNSDESNETANNVPINVIIPGLTTMLFSPVTIVFKSNKTTNSCAYWDYGQNRLLNNVKGRWDPENIGMYVGQSQVICQPHHLTHFSILVVGSSSYNNSLNMSETDRLALEIMTIVGCTLSFCGLLAILITAFVFKRWRKHNGNVIILNFSVCLSAQMCLTFVADNIDVDEVGCFVAALLLHYFMVSEFCWMMVIAFLQYRKFVTVFQQPAPHLIAKVSVFGWVLPLVPVAIVNIVSHGKAYQKNSFGLCYPVNNFYTYGVLLPIGIMVVINFSIFLLIMKNVCSRKVKAYGSNAKDMKLQFLLAFLLFFLLGISWAFGLLTALSSNIFFAYLFCITATMQGFVMFIFFIVMNDNARGLWLGLKKMCSVKKDPDAQRKTSAHFSTTSISTLSGVLDESKIK